MFVFTTQDENVNNNCNMYIGIDSSISAVEKDFNFRPTRLQVIKQSLQQFIRNYFDQNPISQICLAR